jgi:acetyl-CoA synthetase
MGDMTIDALLKEERTFPPPAEFAQHSWVNSEEPYRRAEEDFEKFWTDFAEELHWFQKWSKVLDWKPPHAKWFVGGKLNVSYNCLDRHLSIRKNKAAIIWEGEPGETRTLTYDDLYLEANKFANVLKTLGVKRGDRVAIYLPMIPELPIAMLACTRIGAIHSVVFSAFSAQALRDRIQDSQAKVLITADGYYRSGNIEALKERADKALEGTSRIERVVVVKRLGREILMASKRDHWWHELMKAADDFCAPEEMDAEDPLYILYTSGSTGNPKGVLHTTGGYLTGVYATTKWVFDLKESDTYWCTADIGWVTGHSYIVYGPLSNGATSLIYEGSPDYPEKDRFWTIIEKHKVSILYTAPTAIRTFMKWGAEWPERHDLSSLRLLGTVGEPINPEAWVWYHRTIGKGRCPVVDTWWQTETGSILITPLPGQTVLKPGSATKPFPGIGAAVVDEQGKEVPLGTGGFLVLTRPWPSMLRTIYGDPDRYVKQYWGRFGDKLYFTGDGAKRDKDGYFWLLGRIDDVINVSGHRISTMEVESALVEHEAVAEAAAVGVSHELKGQAIMAFVTLEDGHQPSEELKESLREKVKEVIGPIAKPDTIVFTDDLPKTRSGKIMRRILHDLSAGRPVGDTTTLRDPGVVERIKQQVENRRK